MSDHVSHALLDYLNSTVEAMENLHRICHPDPVLNPKHKSIVNLATPGIDEETPEISVKLRKPDDRRSKGRKACAEELPPTKR